MSVYLVFLSVPLTTCICVSSCVCLLSSSAALRGSAYVCLAVDYSLYHTGVHQMTQALMHARSGTLTDCACVVGIVHFSARFLFDVSSAARNSIPQSLPLSVFLCLFLCLFLFLSLCLFI